MTDPQNTTATQRKYAVLIAYAEGELSEGQASKLLDCDRVSLRETMIHYREIAEWLVTRHKANGATVNDDLRQEWLRAPRISPD